MRGEGNTEMLSTIDIFFSSVCPLLLFFLSLELENYDVTAPEIYFLYMNIVYTVISYNGIQCIPYERCIPLYVIIPVLFRMKCFRLMFCFFTFAHRFNVARPFFFFYIYLTILYSRYFAYFCTQFQRG
uniref:Uncharacterized protein n=1 Tax=Cacopsylla melanoneura TaxID=428564 RepID=A0A8D9BZS6_9HEMI